MKMRLRDEVLIFCQWFERICHHRDTLTEMNMPIKKPTNVLPMRASPLHKRRDCKYNFSQWLNQDDIENCESDELCRDGAIDTSTRIRN